MKKAVFAIPLVALLSACGAPSVESLLENPEKLMEISQECMMLMAQGKDTNTAKCNNAAEAQKLMAENLMRGMMEQMGR